MIDAVRPHAQALWAGLSADDKARFIRHVRPWWDIHRHRMAPPVAATLNALRASGAVQTHAGRVAAIEPAAHGLQVRWRPKGEAAEQVIAAQRVIDCSGANGDHAQSNEPLIQQMLADGLARPAPFNLGVDCATWGALIGSARCAVAGPVRGRSGDPGRLVGDHRRARDPRPGRAGGGARARCRPLAGGGLGAGGRPLAVALGRP